MFTKHAKLNSLLKAKLHKAGLLKKLRAGEFKFPTPERKSTLFAIPESLRNVGSLTSDDLVKMRRHHYGRVAAKNPDKGFMNAVNELGESGAITPDQMRLLMDQSPHWANIAKGMQAKGKPTKNLELVGKEITGIGAGAEVVTRNLLKMLTHPSVKPHLKGKKTKLNISADSGKLSKETKRVTGKPHLRLVE